MATNRMQVRALASALLVAALAAPAPLTGRAAEAEDNKIGRWKLRVGGAGAGHARVPRTAAAASPYPLARA